MSINKKFFTPRREIQWDGIVVCDVKGVTPNDIARTLAENAADLETLMEAWKTDDAMRVLALTPEAEDVSKFIADNSTTIFTKMIGLVPNLCAKIIAIAAGDADEWEHVRDEYTLPLQFDILTTIAELTFINQDGFKKFLGNVMALAGSVNGKSPRLTTTPNHLAPSTGS